MAIDRNYGVPDFPIPSDPFDNPKSPKTFSTELENTDTFDVQDIFELGFLRSDPEIKRYQHKYKPQLILEEKYEIDFSVKDKVVRIIAVYSNILGTKTYLYFKSKPNKEDIQRVIDTF